MSKPKINKLTRICFKRYRHIATHAEETP